VYATNGDYRFTSEHVSAREGERVYVDPSAWCIHGDYGESGKHVVTGSNVTAHLAQIHPFTLGWIADLHSTSTLTEEAKELMDGLALCNPTLTVLGGDIVAGSGVYGYYKGETFLPGIEDGWFEEVWNYVRDRLPNNLWLKGNHDVDPGCYFFHNWFERLWQLRVGTFKLIGFDSYNEQAVVPGQCTPYLSLPDMIWLRRRLLEDRSKKVLLVHHPFYEWHAFSPEVFKDVPDIVCVFSGHDHVVGRKETQISWGKYSVPEYTNGTAAPEAQPHLATVSMFWKDGTERTTLMDGRFEVSGDLDIEVRAPKALDWDRDAVKAHVPVRLVRRLEEGYLNVIVLCPSESAVHVEIRERAEHAVELSSDAKTYVTGRNMRSLDRGEAYDSWTCSCGAAWSCYHADPRRPTTFKFVAPRS